MKTYENFIKNLFKKKPKIDYYKNGQKEYEGWWLYGKLHREDGPAYQYWYYNGQKQSEGWWLYGKQHREDGSAYKWWSLNGKKEFEWWFLNGKRYLSREEWIEQLKRIGSPHYEEQRMLLDMEKYNI